jgi:murein L,D-transpeptidase YcbB/YkuD
MPHSAFLQSSHTGRTLPRSIAALMLSVMALPALAQSPADTTVTPETTAATASTITAVPTEIPAQERPAEAAPIAATKLDPILARVRERLGDTVMANADRDERQALAAFYRDASAPLWVAATGPTPRGAAALAEIGNAADWGLSLTAFELPDMRSVGESVDRAADAEIRLGLAVLKYARHARGGRLNPASLSRFFDQTPPLKAPAVVLQEIALAPAADAYLRGLHPRHPQFEALRQALIKSRTVKPETAKPAGGPDTSVRIADGAIIKIGQSNSAVSDLRRRLGVTAEDESKASFLDAKLVDTLKAFQREAGIAASGNLDKATRMALNRPPNSSAPGSEAQRLVANMERWRWLPADLGEFHVWDNIPEYQARVVDKGKVVHQARIIVGKIETQTPLFSADMRYIVLHPGWGVPDSIKVKDLLPYLRPSQSFFGFGGTDTAVLKRHNLTVNLNGRPVDPSTINWQQTDIRRYSFIQPPGASNVLGIVKFRFPNKHDVYMHDTSQRELFNQSRRTYSHGCVRVDNPKRLAEILLEKDRGMAASEVTRLLSSGPKDNQIELKAKIPVHITYFTAMAEPDGLIKTYADIYGHDARVTAALSGRPMALEPAADTAQVARREVKKPVRQAAQSQGSDFFSGLFGN